MAPGVLAGGTESARYIAGSSGGALAGREKGPSVWSSPSPYRLAYTRRCAACAAHVAG